jgi:hypothetical protein
MISAWQFLFLACFSKNTAVLSGDFISRGVIPCIVVLLPLCGGQTEFLWACYQLCMLILHLSWEVFWQHKEKNFAEACKKDV